MSSDPVIRPAYMPLSIPKRAQLLGSNLMRLDEKATGKATRKATPKRTGTAATQPEAGTFNITFGTLSFAIQYEEIYNGALTGSSKPQPVLTLTTANNATVGSDPLTLPDPDTRCGREKDHTNVQETHLNIKNIKKQSTQNLSRYHQQLINGNELSEGGNRQQTKSESVFTVIKKNMYKNSVGSELNASTVENWDINVPNAPRNLDLQPSRNLDQIKKPKGEIVIRSSLPRLTTRCRHNTDDSPGHWTANQQRYPK